MSISDIFESGIQKNNIAHFATIVHMATIDGAMNKEEEELLFNFANKLDITHEIGKEVIKNPLKYAIAPVHSKEDRMQHLYDLFKIIFADHYVDPQELHLIHKYAIGLGFSEQNARRLIKKSIRIFQGKLDFEEYHLLIESA